MYTKFHEDRLKIDLLSYSKGSTRAKKESGVNYKQPSDKMCKHRHFTFNLDLDVVARDAINGYRFL